MNRTPARIKRLSAWSVASTPHAVIGGGVAVQSQGDELLLPAGQRLRILLTAAVTVSYKPQILRENPSFGRSIPKELNEIAGVH